MAATIIKQGRTLLSKLDRSMAVQLATAAALAAVVLVVARHSGLWWCAAMVVVGAEGWGLARRMPATRRRELVFARLPVAVAGVAVAVIIALESRLVSQFLTACTYVPLRWWWTAGAAREAGDGELVSHRLWRLLAVQALVFEAVFLAAAIVRLPAWLVLVVVWGGVYGTTYSVLSGWKERSTAVLAATWALVAAEVSWVLQLWLFTYTTAGGYVLVPQPALILTALGYCFGSVYWSQRQGNLSRGRLTEYLLIGLILIVIVAVGTSWRGSI